MGADFNREILPNRREGLDLMPTGTGNRYIMQFWMNAFFHGGGC